MISTEDAWDVVLDEGRNGNVFGTLGILCCEHIPRSNLKRPDLAWLGSRVHEVDRLGNALVLVNIDIVAETHRPLILECVLVDVAEDDIGNCVDTGLAPIAG